MATPASATPPGEHDVHRFPVSPFDHDPVAARAAGTLTDLETAVLDFEAAGWWRSQGARDAAILDRLGITTVRYHQVLNGLLVVPAAVAAYPMLVARLRRLRETRRAHRTARPGGVS